MWRVQRALKDFVEMSWDGLLRSSTHVAVIRCSVWAAKTDKSSVLCSGLKATKDDVKKEIKKVRVESIRRRMHEDRETSQEPIDTATLLKAFTQAEQLDYRENSTRICIYIGTCRISLNGVSLKATSRLTFFMRRVKGKIQRNNYQYEQCGPLFAGKTSSVSLIVYLHTLKSLREK